MKTASVSSHPHVSARVRKDRTELVIKTIIGIIFISPVLMALVFSFVPNEKLFGLPKLQTVLDNLTLENYRWMFKNIPVAKYLTNTLSACFLVIIVQTITSTLAAYAFAYLDFRGKDTIFQIVLVAMMIPSEVCIICNFLTVRDMGMTNTLIGLCITSFVSCNAIFMMRQTFKTLPHEIREATLLEGCSELRFMVQFAVPLSISSICSLAITTFMGVYNSYLWPLLIARDSSHYTVQIGMSLLVVEEVPTYGRSMAGAILCMSIPVIMFIIFQGYMVKGLTRGAVKG